MNDKLKQLLNDEHLIGPVLDLIKTIAIMHDTIQDWDNGWGLTNETAFKLKEIGKDCIKICQKRQDWYIVD